MQSPGGRSLLLAFGLWLFCAGNGIYAGDTKKEIQRGLVVAVTDGDTIKLLLPDKTLLVVRLEGIDAPETRGKQPFGQASKQALSDLIFKHDVELTVTGQDRYQRTLGDIRLGDTWVNLEMVRLGMAWHYLKYSRDKELADAEASARTAKRGLWADVDPVAPWDWRKPKAKAPALPPSK